MSKNEWVSRTAGWLTSETTNIQLNTFLATTDHHLSALHVDALWKHPNDRKVI
ncbi:hypothetical protein K450DRAFT_217009 [Umbelopsis ramanniana AG]|uniref:Uncharacterized protein n=1 Tax=Umbelopsis ramanniana AG TaxID=1314678 RepID=A0AAD5EJN7_UMBRA|nr:uncharacterized protein K450DRAFT_217009 [Umbelopsis ramanniana AG]KAI8584584.1 hypothetical protein K450DRAFT_217009 [Umbelopsis ramanniana AG]